jgi:hypothetical protein
VGNKGSFWAGKDVDKDVDQVIHEETYVKKTWTHGH